MTQNETNMNTKIDTIRNLMGFSSTLVSKNFLIGKTYTSKAVLFYINGLADKNVIDRDILNPLMLHISENLSCVSNVENYICEKYITMSNAFIETDINRAVDELKRGKTILLLEKAVNFIILDTTGGVYRGITDALNETSTRGTRESFVENLETNISILRRIIKDKNLTVERLVVGRRSQKDLSIIYMDDIVDKKLLEEIRARISSIDMDVVGANAIVEQCIEKYSFSIFPQVLATERVDRVEGNLMEGRIAVILQGTPYVLIIPSLFNDFFQTVEDYFSRTIVASFTRIIRYIAVFLIITLPSVYLTLIKFNAHLIPPDFIQALIQSRKGIALTPFMSMLSMNLAVEFLREGGLRLPSKIGQTLSVVGGIIIGDAALKAKMVSSSTLLVVGITTIATFLIPNYEMSLAIRVLNYPMLILANWLGMLGISVGGFFIIAYLCSMDSFGVPYFSFNKNDFKDTIIRAPIWKMQRRPRNIPNNNPIRQTNFKWKLRREKDG